MVRLGAAALAIAVVLGASAASADDANFAAFHRICIATGGERGAALAAAEAEGFVQPPKAILDQVAHGAVPLGNAEVRAKLIKDGIVWVSVGRMSGAFENRYTSTDMCVGGVSPMSPESEKAAIVWVGVTPAVSDPQFQMLLFTGGEGAHRAVPKAEGGRQDAGRGRQRGQAATAGGRPHRRRHSYAVRRGESRSGALTPSSASPSPSVRSPSVHGPLRILAAAKAALLGGSPQTAEAVSAMVRFRDVSECPVPTQSGPSSRLRGATR